MSICWYCYWGWPKPVPWGCDGGGFMRRRVQSPLPEETRIVKRFIIFPLVLAKEWVWWEWAFIKQKYIITHYPDRYEPMIGDWVDMRFVDEAGSMSDL